MGVNAKILGESIFQRTVNRHQEASSKISGTEHSGRDITIGHSVPVALSNLGDHVLGDGLWVTHSFANCDWQIEFLSKQLDNVSK